MNWIKGIVRFWKTIQIILLFLVSILLVYFMFPREGKFKYEYSKNKPWMHETLVAPFDIPIYKPDQQLQRERDSLLRNVQLYFFYDSLIGSNMLSTFTSDYNNLVSSMGFGAYVSDAWSFTGHVISDVLEDIYSIGVIERNPVLEGQELDQLSIMVMKNTLAEEYRFRAFYTERSAYEYLISEIERINPGSLAILNRMTLNDYLRSNVLYNEDMTSKVRQANLEGVTITQGMVQAGQRIISRGELVSGSNFLVIESLRREYESNPNVGKNYLVVYMGQFLLITLIFLALFWFIYYFGKDILTNRKQTFFTLGLIVVMVGLTRAASTNDAVSVYVIPFVVVPIFLKTFFNIRYALFVHMITLLLAGFWVPNSYQFVMMNFLAGLVGVFSLRSYYRRGILFYTATFVFATYAMIYILLSIMQEGDLAQINWINVLWLAGNGLLILTVYPLVFLFERIFGFLSDATLFELSDTNQPLLRKLAEKAPGTFQHSMQVANLAEEAILKVGGNSLLVRAGALYHDIGKMENPHYFIENQHDGVNPHGDLDYRSSAKVIIDHVIQGMEIGKKHGLPEKIIDCIRMHHGTSTAQYFYRSFINDNPNEEVEISEFTYPGPKPDSKETAVLMIADSVEAASRTLKKYSPETIHELVENIIAHQTKEDQFSDTTLTFADITIIKEIFKNRLSNIYHSRIEYPE
ncbi:MAG: HDIG domain-containing protein [Bacteroidales bacterium]|nr:HDIG domain-containing protein [Bacteroidales bacterium]